MALVRFTLEPGGKRPVRAHKGDAGTDVFARLEYPERAVTLFPSQRALVKLGFRIAVPHGYYARVAPRSGLALGDGIDVLAGVIDAGFRGEVAVLLINHGRAPFEFKHHDKIAQIIIEKIADDEWVEDNALSDSERGENGYGSTGT